MDLWAALQADQGKLADVPDRVPLWPRLRYRYRGGLAGHIGEFRRPAPPTPRGPHAPGHLRGWHVAAGYGRRGLHGEGLLLGLLEPDPEDLLQPYRHRAVGLCRPLRRQHRIAPDLQR